MTRKCWIILAILMLGCLAEAWIVAQAWGQCAGGQCQVPQYTAPARPQQQPHPAVCRVRNSSGRVSCYGSGTLIESSDGRGLIITCHHLFREGVGTITVTFPDGQRHVARLLGHDPEWDLAALEIASPQATPVAVSQNYPRPGDILRACGYGSDGRYVCSMGEALGYTRPSVGATYETLEMQGAAREGDSGGPVFNQKGELCAVLWGTDGRIIGSTFCGRVRKFLANIIGRRQPPIGGGAAGIAASGGSSGGMTPPLPATPRPDVSVPAAPLVPVAPQAPACPASNCDGIATALEQIKSLKDDLRAIREGATKQSTDANALQKAVEATVGQRVSDAVSAAVKPIATQQGDLGGRLERIAGVIEKLQTAREAVTNVASPTDATSSSPLSWVGNLASGAATTWLVGLGVASPVALGLVLAGRWLGKRAAKKIAGNVVSRIGEASTATADPSATQSTTQDSQTVIIREAKPLPQVTVREQEIVQVEVPTKRLRAIEMAMAEFARKYPGSSSTVQTLNDMARQYESGLVSVS
jgi:hypothetical protein